MQRLTPPRSGTRLAAVLALLSCLVLTQCETALDPAPSTIRIGTWNIEHFGSRTAFQNRPGSPPDRTAAEVEKVAAFITGMKVDVLALQEISNPAALQHLLGHLGEDYRFVLGTTGVFGNTRISVGFLWNHRRVELLQCGEMSDWPSKVGDLSVFHRKPVNAAFRVIGDKGFDFRAITVHLKASRGSKNQRKRCAEVKLIAEYIKKLAADTGEDQDIVVLGDFNHAFGAPACKEFTADKAVQYIRAIDPAKLSPTIVWPQLSDPIDHIALAGSMAEELIEGSRRVHNQQVDWQLKGEALTASKAVWRQAYSDHFPVTIDLRADRDLDPNAKFTPAGKSLQTGK